MSMYKVFPKGDFFMLGGAIEAAIADGVDILNMSLGSTTLSPDIVQQISMARDAGIACFVAAGNSGNGVQFPAMLSSVMAVGAIGHTAAMPADSMSANTLAANFAAPDGFFSPSFTCFGPSIDFAAPGVGVISTYPGNGLKALDGTSMATPHLAGLAALYLEHDPGLRSAARNAARTDLLFDMLRQRSSRLPFAADRVGNGMPMLVKPLQPFVHPTYGQPHTFMSAVMAARPGAWMNGDGSAGARHAGCDHP
jgi:subtilisin family serine protease